MTEDERKLLIKHLWLSWGFDHCVDERAIDAFIAAIRADERARCEAEFEIDKLDAQRWRRYRKNPYDATDQILKALNVDKSCHWATQADEAIDAAIQYWRAE